MLANSLHLKFSIKDFFIKCDQTRKKLWIWSHLLKKSLMENLIFCAVIFKEEHYSCSLKSFSWIFADVPASGSSFFLVVRTEFSSNPSARLVRTDFGLIQNSVFLFRPFFLLQESITEIKCKPVFFNSFSSSHPAGNYMFKVNNRSTRIKVWNMCKVNNKATKTTRVVLVALLLTLNIFHTFVLVFLLLTFSR